MDPWSTIAISDNEGEYISQLVSPEHSYDFFWSKTVNGHYAFRFIGEFSLKKIEDLPKMQGLKLLVGNENLKNHITLILEDKDDHKIFYLLCMSLIEATNVLEKDNADGCVLIIINHLMRWQRLLQNRRNKKELSVNEQVGLLGELLVLKDFFNANLNPELAVLTWTGPLGDEQDFGYNNSKYEVKTTRATRDRKIQISSADQLDPQSSFLFLVVQTITESNKDAKSVYSLSSLVKEVREIIRSYSVVGLDGFEMRLLLAGYENLSSYDLHYYSLTSRMFYSVEGKFPRICAKDIPTGVVDIKYSIMVDKCQEWVVSEGELIKEMFDNA